MLVLDLEHEFTRFVAVDVTATPAVAAAAFILRLSH